MLSFVNVVERVVKYELDILAKSEPRQHLGMLGDQLEVFRRAELDAHGVGVRVFLNRRIGPLLAVLEEVLAGNELRLLRLLYQVFFAPVTG